MTKSRNCKYSFEEYKMYYESTEKVTDRRLNGNKINYSICITVLGVLGLLFKFALDKPDYTYPIYSLIFVLSIISCIYSLFWLMWLRDYKLLNNAKFEILKRMAKDLTFESQPLSGENLVSYSPFDKEWEYIGNPRKKNKKKKGINLSAYNIELVIPGSFLVLFLATIVICFIACTPHLDEFGSEWRGLLKINSQIKPDIKQSVPYPHIAL